LPVLPVLFLARSSFLKFITRRIFKIRSVMNFKNEREQLTLDFFSATITTLVFLFYPLDQHKRLVTRHLFVLSGYSPSQKIEFGSNLRSLNRPWVPPPKVRTVPNSKDPAGKPSCNVSASCCFLHRFRYDKFLLSFVNCHHICNQFARYCQCCSVSIPFTKLFLMDKG